MTTNEQILTLIQQAQNHTLNPLNGVILASLVQLPGSPEWKLQVYRLLAPFLSTLHPSPLTLTVLIILWPELILLFVIVFTIFLVQSIQAIFPHIMRLVLLQRKPEVSSFLELTFPSDTSKSSYATEQLYQLLHTLGRQQTFRQRLAQHKKRYALELVATRKEGIRYVISLPEREKDIFKKNLFSYLSGIQIREVTDYLDQALSRTTTLSLAELKLSGHHALPLQKQKVLSIHDPIAYLTGNMTKLKDGEIISFQIVTTPVIASVHRKISGEMRNLRHKMYRGKPLTPALNNGFFKTVTSFPVISVIWLFVKGSIYFLMAILKFLLDMISAFASNESGRQVTTSQMQQSMALSQELLNPYEKELQTIVKEKIDQHLFEASIRVLVAGSDAEEIQDRMSGLLATVGQMNSTYQSLTTKGSILPSKFLINQRLTQFKKRMLSPNRAFNQNPILSTSEISDLYHFPYTATTKTEDMVTIHSKELPAPLSLKRTDSFDVIFAKNTYGGEETPIGLLLEERRRHMAFFGATGSGKSTLMLSMINEDIKNGKGICVTDPHGQLAEQVLVCIQQAGRSDDLVLFNPDDLAHLVAINLMELTPGLNKYDALREKEFICESIISLFRKVFNDSFGSNPHRIESILRNTIHTAFTVEGATLFTIYDLLIDPAMRAKTVSKLTDERLQKFWKNLYGKAGNWQQVKMIAPVTSRIERFLFSPSAYGILKEKQSTINIDAIMDQGKILVCNLSKGMLGEDTSQVLGMLILTKIQLATLKRARIPEENRRDFYLYVDEFQHFATLSFVQMLSEARKYHLNLIIAEQSTAQQKDKQITNILFANTGTIGTFKTASPQDEAMILPQFEPYVTKGEIHNLPAYHFYMKIGALHPEEPFSGVTIPLDLKPDNKALTAMITLSNEKYAIKETSEPENEKIADKKVKPRMKQTTSPVTSKRTQKAKENAPKRQIKTGQPENRKKQ
ncbi:MAG TPA: DUF87 domain-containing protein [Candidatus Sulfotelmatobacter sp.]|jgi:hypothetical protein|nr:DUF87 domain-containing protein [Candidatus Sulfotelmatobacter sp.]